MLDALKARLGEVADLEAAAAVLSWDQETYMPPAAAEARAQQLATLQTLAHTRFTDDATGQLLDDAEAAYAGDGDPGDGDPGDGRLEGRLDAAEAAAAADLLRVTRRDYDRKRKLPADLVTRLAKAVARAKEAWRTARQNDDFAAFAPHLQRIVDLNVEKAEALGYAGEPYDALVDAYEPGMTTAEVEAVFADLRADLVPIVAALAAAERPDTRVLHRRYPIAGQHAFGEAVLRDLGYDFARGRLDVSAHPFTTTFDVSDVRLTTRYDEAFFPTAFFGTVHEAGHGLYEQGIDAAFARTPLADGASLGMHESQSRLWENLVARSRPFWTRYFGTLQQTFPTALHDADADAFYRAVTLVEPSLIRVEADEVTYPLHVMLRFELERGLVAGTVDVDTLPDRWNAKMEAYLGVVPDTDADGVLQDIHWSLGALGYFPTYALGTLMSVPLFDAARADLAAAGHGDLDDLIAAGTFGPLLDWLRQHVHRHGRAKTATEILTDATGGPLDAAPWLAYVRRKYGALYDVDLDAA